MERDFGEFKERENLKRCIQTVMKQINIPPNFLGYKYLEAILIDKFNQRFNCKFYEEYAIIFNTRAIRVERAIRYICDNYQRRLQSFFKTDYKITNKKLFYLLKKAIRKELWRCI